jgi:DNA processing protein
MSNPPNENTLYTLALSQIPQLGPQAFRNILAYTGSIKAFFELSPGKAAKIPRITPKLLAYRKNLDTYLREADKILKTCSTLGISVISIADSNYPGRLKSLEDCPMILYVKGNGNLNPLRTVSIVGTRNATEYGKSITRKIIEDLAPYSPTIVSGLAYGIDIESHRSSLQHNLPTLGILGSAVNKIYPSAHKFTAEAMVESGGLLSEYLPGSEMHPTNFPKRNRIIAGLGDVLIVVEAAQKGGALITAEIAYSYNKEIFAVPGNLQAPFSEGCNNLIKTMKAAIYTGPKDLEEALSWTKYEEGKSSEIDPNIFDWFDGEEKKILNLLQQQGKLEIDQLGYLTDLPLSTLAVKLLNLEFEGYIQSLPGKKYELTKKSPNKLPCGG